LISKCSGEYITQLDDDDEYYPEKIQKQVHLLDNSPKKVGVVYCWEEFWDDRSDTKLYNNKPSVRGDAYLKLLEKSCVGGGTTMMMRKSACDFVGGLDESIKLAADYQLNINLSKHYNHDFVPEVLVRTHINHNYNRLTDMKVPIMQHADMIEYIEKILHDHKDAFDQYPHLRFNHYRSIMHSAAKNRDFATFVKYLKLGFALTDSFQEKLLYSSRGIKHFILSK
jgi:glycosyltransferase involved in cell wall biosynthesis